MKTETTATVDGDELDIDREWLSGWAKKDPNTWSIPGTDLFLYWNVSGLRRYWWSLHRVMEDGEEIDFCCVTTRGELRRTLNVFSRAETGEDYPHWPEE